MAFTYGSSDMRKQDHLRVAEYCFMYMQAAKTDKSYGNQQFWEKRMYESLFEWAGWKID